MALPRSFRSTFPWERSELLFSAVSGEAKYKISIVDSFNQNNPDHYREAKHLYHSRFQEIFY